MRSFPARSSQVDSVRAIAALSVLVFHSIGFAGGLVPGTRMQTIFFPAESGVTIFLVISGFLLYRPFVRAHCEQRDPPLVLPYGVRRFMRIVPAFWVALTISAIVLSWDYVFTAKGVATFYTLGQVYTSPPLDESAIGPAWTLGLELSFYAFLPLWAWLVRRLSATRTGSDALAFHAKALACLFAASCAYKALMVNAGDFGGINPAGYAEFATLPANLDNFVLGMALALLSIGREQGLARHTTAADWIAARAGFCWAVAIGSYVLAALLIVPQSPTGLFSHKEYAMRIVLYWGIGFGLVAPAAMESRAVVGRILQVRVLALAGLISYGIYLWHWPVLRYIQEHGGSLFDQGSYASWVAVTVAATCVLATLSWLLVERPSIDLGRRLRTRSLRFAPDDS